MDSTHASDATELKSSQVRSLLALGLSGRDSIQEGAVPSADEILSSEADVLRQVLDALNTPCPDCGPLSIFALADVEPIALGGQSWLTLLASRETSDHILKCLGHVGRLLSRLNSAEVPKLTGDLIQLLATQALNDEQQEMLKAISESRD